MIPSPTRSNPSHAGSCTRARRRGSARQERPVRGSVQASGGPRDAMPFGAASCCSGGGAWTTRSTTTTALGSENVTVTTPGSAAGAGRRCSASRRRTRRPCARATLPASPPSGPRGPGRRRRGAFFEAMREVPLYTRTAPGGQPGGRTRMPARRFSRENPGDAHPRRLPERPGRGRHLGRRGGQPRVGAARGEAARRPHAGGNAGRPRRLRVRRPARERAAAARDQRAPRGRNARGRDRRSLARARRDGGRARGAGAAVPGRRDHGLRREPAGDGRARAPSADTRWPRSSRACGPECAAGWRGP